MRVRVRTILPVVLLFCLSAQAEDLVGRARIVDGDTLWIGVTKIRLEGIDAPETDQICLDAAGRRWTCGIEAREQLAAHVAGQEISCRISGVDGFRRALGTCKAAGENLNRWMTQQGWALAFMKYSSAYIVAEEEARASKRGLWQGAFIAPWDWRHRNNKTEILGALSVPKDAQANLLAPSGAENAPSPECTIKGNINRKGERIYHLQNQGSYPKIRMDSTAERRWFCTPEEAEAAGWRRALR